MAWLLGIYIAGYPVAVYLIAGMWYSEFIHDFKALDSVDYRREKRHQGISIGVTFGIWWPIILPLAFVTCGYAKHGIWKAPPLEQEK